MPVYWKPKYGTRSSRHRDWARQEAKRERRLDRERRTGIGGWLRGLFGRRGSR
jgi:hypothetical protein